jgi:hypothetical protein
VTFQPIRSTGRHARFDYAQHSITLSEVRRSLLDSLRLPDDSFVPHPVNPERVCIGVLSAAGDDVVPSTARYFGPGAALSRTELLYPVLRSQDGDDAHQVRVAIVSYLDKHDFTTSASQSDGVHFLADDGRLIPLTQRFAFEHQTPPLAITRPSPR